MKNSNLNKEYLDDEIDLLELLRTLYSSKKLIILITLASALLAFAYLSQKEAEYQSTVILEVGTYDLTNGEKKLVEPVSSLIQKLKINEISKQLNELNFNSIEDHFLEIDVTSPSPEFNENLINEAIRFAQESHAESLDNIVNSFSEKIVTIDNEIKYQQESQKLIAIKAIKTLDINIPALETKIKNLLELIPEEENNLLLLESNPSALLQRTSSSPTLQEVIFSYKLLAIDTRSELALLKQEKEALEMQVKSNAEGEFTSEELFILNQEKEALEMQVKLAKDQTNSTQPIRELVTSEIKPKQLLTILIGTILGFIFSVFIVFIRQAFLKEQN
ncbi:Wzz/FepE/Etk N-terminal domain-containing protein [Candidatus Pseudothioglobus singularis]|nr:Wzz/FepE/Etk N-terminal domain-containing protein [Candidatus Pseudothioglobus singularis]